MTGRKPLTPSRRLPIKPGFQQRSPSAPRRFVRINTQIQVPRLRLIDENGHQVGIVTREEALARARAAELDLVEIVPQATPPVCRVMDFHKYKYEQEKREREARKKQKLVEQKEIRFSPVISDHDYNFKKEHIIQFLKEGNRVKVQIRFRGRQIVHSERGKELIARLTQELAPVAAVERPSRFEGPQIDIIFRPL